MTIAVAASFMVPILTAYCAISLIWPNADRAEMPLRLSLSIGLGLGISSAVYFAWLATAGSSRGFFILEAAVLVSTLAVIAYRSRARIQSATNDRPIRPSRRHPGFTWSLRAGFSAVFLASIAYFLALSRAYPHGRWDALTIWNLRARFLFRGGDHWRDAFSDHLGDFAQPSYPLLVSGAIARAWEFIGVETTLAPAAVAMLFTFATVALLGSSLSNLRSENQGLLAGMVLLGTVALVWQGSTQYADVPLAFFILAAVVTVVLSERRPEGAFRFLALAGFLGGLAAWTKNEGTLFLLALLLGYSSVVLYRRGPRSALLRSGSIVIGAAPILLLVSVFKLGIAPTDGLVESFAPGRVLGDLTDAARWGSVIPAFVTQTVAFGGWLISLPLALALYLYAVGVEMDDKDVAGVSSVALVVALVLAGYCLVLLTTPYNLEWHLETSLHRLILHVWPSAIFIYFMIARTPERSLDWDRALTHQG